MNVQPRARIVVVVVTVALCMAMSAVVVAKKEHKPKPEPLSKPLLGAPPPPPTCTSSSSCPAEPNAVSTPCSGGVCTLVCAGNWYNSDQIYDNGCECSDNTFAKSCLSLPGLGNSQFVTTPAPGSLQTKIGNLPAPNEENWFVATFQNDGKQGDYHPQIYLSSVAPSTAVPNPPPIDPTIVFDLFQTNGNYSCANFPGSPIGVTPGSPGATCNIAPVPGPTAVSVVSWGATEQNDGHIGQHNTPMPNYGVILIRVHRTQSIAQPLCNPYQLNIQN